MASSTISGLGSGLDISGIVKALADAEKSPKQTQINTQTQTATTSLSAIGTVKSALDTFRAAIAKLNTASSFSGLASSSSDEAIAKIKLGMGLRLATMLLKSPGWRRLQRSRHRSTKRLRPSSMILANRKP